MSKGNITEQSNAINGGFIFDKTYLKLFLICILSFLNTPFLKYIHPCDFQVCITIFVKCIMLRENVTGIVPLVNYNFIYLLLKSKLKQIETFCQVIEHY